MNPSEATPSLASQSNPDNSSLLIPAQTVTKINVTTTIDSDDESDDMEMDEDYEMDM